MNDVKKHLHPEDSGASLLFVTMSNLFAHIHSGGFFGGLICMIFSWIFNQYQEEVNIGAAEL